MRPHQWIKNGFVSSLISARLGRRVLVSEVLELFAAFCLVSTLYTS